jgi:hypothetical protein
MNEVLRFIKSINIKNTNAQIFNSSSGNHVPNNCAKVAASSSRSILSRSAHPNLLSSSEPNPILATRVSGAHRNGNEPAFSLRPANCTHQYHRMQAHLKKSTLDGTFIQTTFKNRMIMPA